MTIRGSRELGTSLATSWLGMSDVRLPQVRKPSGFFGYPVAANPAELAIMTLRID